jgi:hypothetical protein
MFKTKLKKITPAPIWHTISKSYWGWHNRGQHVLAKTFNPLWHENQKRILSYQDIHKRKRCFILGNGPSLRKTDLSRLQGEYTFGLNRIYLAFPEMGFTTTYLVTVNTLVLEQCIDDFQNLSLPRFYTWRARRWFSEGFYKNPSLMFLDTDYTGSEVFSGDASGRLYEGFTVTFVAMQLAFFMGFEEVILIGIDHNFTSQGPANTAVVSGGDDPNHFTPNYFGKGFRWQLPDLEGSERAYNLARQSYAQAGRRILDATIGGKLTIFPKVAYGSLFPES